MGILELQNLTYSYDKKRKVLRGINAQMEAGKMYAILGPSGCGKTTLLSLLGGLDSPTSGNILFEGKDIAQAGLAGHRKKNVSFIFQSYNLIDYMTPQENVRLTSKKPALPFLERLGLTREESKRNVLKLSSGQQQRVSLFCAIFGIYSFIVMKISRFALSVIHPFSAGTPHPPVLPAHLSG